MLIFFDTSPLKRRGILLSSIGLAVSPHDEQVAASMSRSVARTFQFVRSRMSYGTVGFV